MIIEEKDFKLTQDDCYDRFTLELLCIINAKDAEKKREEFKIEGYSMTLENCLNKIINYRLANKKEVYSLKEYIQEYRDEKGKLNKLLSNEA